MLYVYGIVDAAEFVVLRGEGHEGGDILPVPADRLAGAVSHLPAGVIEATAGSVWRHEQVLGRLMQDHAVLPLRFGTICRDADTLRDRLRRSANELLTDLDRLRGKVEIALRVIEPGGQDEWRDTSAQRGSRSPGGRGTAYLCARRQHHEGMLERERRTRRIGQLLSAYVDVSTTDIAGTTPAEGIPGLSLSCLVDRDRVEALDDALERFRSDHPQIVVRWTGPWAPYSFVTPSAFAGEP